MCIISNCLVINHKLLYPVISRLQREDLFYMPNFLPVLKFSKKSLGFQFFSVASAIKHSTAMATRL